MTQNIEQRTLAATSTMEVAAKSVDEIAHADKQVVTPVGVRDSFPKISRESKEKFDSQLFLQNDEFQKRFALSEKAISWQSGLEINDKFQRFYTGAKGTTSYSEHLPEPSKIPFITGLTFEEDVANGYWIEHGVASVPWTERHVGEITGKQINAKIWPVTGNDSKVGDQIGYNATALWIDGQIRSTNKEIPAGSTIETINSLGGVVTASGVQYKLGGTLDQATASTLGGLIARTLADRFSDIVNVKDFGAVGDDIADDTDAIQSAMYFAKNMYVYDAAVYFPDGVYIITKPLKYLTGTRMFGNGNGSKLKSRGLSLPDDFEQPSDPESYGPLSLTVPPMIYNPSPIQWWSIENMAIDGNNEDVIGLLLYGAYYGEVSKLSIYRCLHKSYVGIRNQAITFNQLATYQSSGCLFFNWSTLKFNVCGFERSKNTDWSLDLRQPVGFNQGAMTMDACWFETEVAEDINLDAPRVGHLRVAGRGNNVTSSLFKCAQNDRIMLGLMDRGDKLEFAGLDMTSMESDYGSYNTTIASNPGQLLRKYVGSECNNNIVHDWRNTDIESANAGANSLLNNNVGNLSDQAYRSFQVRRAFSEESWNLPENFILRAIAKELSQDGKEQINFFANDNNRLVNESGILELQSNLHLRMRPRSGSNFVIALEENSHAQISGLPTSAAGLTAGTIWNDNGTLKIV
ncbi:hypothetical protein HJ101_17430 [Vibrio parahaemolyticus]|nr:hypothetical protein [Vibrio parahaemolyticus]